MPAGHGRHGRAVLAGAKRGNIACMMSDREVEELVRQCLATDSRVDEGEVEVCVEDGTVFLAGAVDSAAERQAAIEDAESTVGVRDIAARLTLRNYVERTDQELREAVRHALARDIAVNTQRVSVEAGDGQVTLNGMVDSCSEKHAAEDVAWWTPGVTNVISHLQVEDEIPADLKE